ncbi:uncharacterized protein LOC116308621 [Actinia tenebrosa]|uniref:Uncharacterized protein LOC116308621 n=1 Tax=Actinia tenebrosa TaxID=6105 RepID=A0A6P8J5I2_ACTTE|nr:uncharacterized protein LOC116308621 [Actinia tenebrosa]
MPSRENPQSNDMEDHRTRILKDCVRTYNRNIKMMEYARLRSLVPSVACKSRVSKIQVIEEAIKYIAHLQQALRTQPQNADQGEANTRNTEPESPEKRRTSLRQKRQRIASYMIKTQRHMPRTRPKFSNSSAKKDFIS